jgi:glycosyltransferase involved in cell wall biosynthesis
MKIAMFIDAFFPRVNGVVISVQSYATELTRLGHQVCVVCPTYTEEQQRSAFYNEDKDKKSVFQILRIPSSPFIWSKEDRAGRLDKWFYLKKQVDLFKPDVVHINTEGNLGLYGRLYAHHRSIPYVYTMHTLWEEYVANYAFFLPEFTSKGIARTIEHAFLKHASQVIVPTKHIEEVAVRYGVSCPVVLLPTGIPDLMEKYSLLRERHMRRMFFKKFPKAFGKKILLYAGRIAKEKNIPFLFDAFDEIHRTNPNTVLILVGSGAELDNLKAAATQTPCADSIYFTGYIRNNDMLYFYRLATVFVFASKTETQGLVTLEAMTAGLPVVAIGEMGTIDVMQGDNGGFMVKEDTIEFARKVNLLLSDTDLRKRKIAEGKRWSRKWSIMELTPKLVQYYENAIAYHKNKHSK